jgi:hypothetical protein
MLSISRVKILAVNLRVFDLRDLVDFSWLTLLIMVFCVEFAANPSFSFI